MRKKLISILTILIVLAATQSVLAVETIEDLKRTTFERRKQLPPYRQPILLTTLGQGAGVSIFGAMAKLRGDFPIEIDQRASGEKLNQYATVIVTLEISARALADLGLNLGMEMVRAESIRDQVAASGAALVLLMFEDRLEQEEKLQPFFGELLPVANFMIVKDTVVEEAIEEGNDAEDRTSDPFIQKAKEEKVPVREARSYSDLLKLASELFRADSEKEEK